YGFVTDIRPGFVVDFFIVEELPPVVLSDLADDFTGVPGCYAPVGNILRDDTSRTDYNVIADMNAGTDHRIPADPAVIADSDLLAVFVGGVPCIRMDRVSRCIDRHIGRHLAVVADLHL